MAVTTQLSDQYKLQYSSTQSELGTVYGTEVKGMLRAEYVTHTQSGAGDATSSVALCKLPPGRCRLILPLCYFYINWTTASATIDIGWDAYTQLDGTAVAANPDGITDGLSVDTADVYGWEELSANIGAGITADVGYAKLFDSKEGVTIRATSQDTAIAAADDLAGVIVYTCA